MKTKLNPHEAPKGYLAIKGTSDTDDCATRCAFGPFRSPKCITATCSALSRKDKTYVYFVESPKRLRSKATFARWWKTQKRKHPWLTNTHESKYVRTCEQIARRAYAAGRRSKT